MAVQGITHCPSCGKCFCSAGKGSNKGTTEKPYFYCKVCDVRINNLQNKTKS